MSPRTPVRHRSERRISPPTAGQSSPFDTPLRKEVAKCGTCFSNICRSKQHQHMFQHLPGRPAPPPPAPAGAAVRSERELLKSLKTTQNHSKPLKIAQNRSESLKSAFKLTQNHENPVNLESFWATYSRFCLRSRDQHSNICSNT